MISLVLSTFRTRLLVLHQSTRCFSSVVVTDEGHYCCVVRILHSVVSSGHGAVVMGHQCEQQRTQDTVLGGAGAQGDDIIVIRCAVLVGVMLDVRTSLYIPMKWGGKNLLRVTMMILRRWGLLLALECIFLGVFSQAPSQKRQCAFQVKPKDSSYLAEGNVSDSVQVCERTYCCVGYFFIGAGPPQVDVLACNKLEKSCPDATCKPQTRVKRIAKCVCNTDLCNSNITWTGVSNKIWTGVIQEHGSTGIVEATWILLVVLSVALLCLVVVALRWKHLSKKKMCSTPTPPTPQIDVTHIQLQQIVARGHFATVWRGTHRGSTVAVKVIPAPMKHAFTLEEEVYKLPLMKHANIIHFLDSGRRSHDGSWLIVLQFAEYGSLHSFLCKNTTIWPLSLKLCHSLSQGLSYLHSDLRTPEGHKPPVAHRDLSSLNVLVRADTTCALCNFGSANILRSSSTRCQTTSPKYHTQVGTLHYKSPEILEGSVNLLSNWCLQADVYAAGLLLWEIWMRCSDLFEDGAPPQHLLPYEQELGAGLTWESLTVHVSHMERRPSVPEHWQMLRQGSVLQDLLRECWDCDPDARLTAQCVADRLVSLDSHLSG
ncbi:activin receptor type-2A-like isoform X2 [Nerophis lumbriciformis]|uniref:activin receptor type-2A-like isoform X2 n=1 Tax=Nerophis lumbriciformis TaxID=546530 RepID=UPI002AE06CE9|nr:activin receptor type-2A-like isoform X2 [Nerophis lumbriciformis]